MDAVKAWAGILVLFALAVALDAALRMIGGHRAFDDEGLRRLRP